MITASISKIEKLGPQVRVTITFDDGTRHFDDVLYLSADSTIDTLKEYARQKAKQIQGIYSLADTLSVGASITIPADPVPTQNELDRKAFFVNLSKLRGMREAVDLGVLPDTDPVYTALLTQLQGDVNTSWF